MTEETEFKEELLTIIKALTSKIEELERTVYSQDNLLMKSGYVVAETPTPVIDNVIGSSVADVSSMDWSDIHKMVESAGGQ